MKAKDVAAELLKTPNAELLVKVGNDWVEVFGVKYTGFHRNAVTLDLIIPDMGGVIVVEPNS